MVYLVGAVVSAFLLGLSTWLIVGALDSREDSRPVAGGVEVTGKVVDVDATSDSTYRAVIEFTDDAGHTHTFRGPSGDQRPEIGEATRVSYDPADPKQAHDLTFNRSSWKWPFGTGIFGVGVTLLATILTVVMVLRQRGRRSVVESSPIVEATPPPPTHTDRGLTGDQRARLVGLWLPALAIWTVRLFVDLPLATPIALTAFAVVMTTVILLVARRRSS